MRTPVFLAKKMGEKLGGSEILQRTLPTKYQTYQNRIEDMETGEKSIELKLPANINLVHEQR
jgi:hypothetical protein